MRAWAGIVVVLAWVSVAGCPSDAGEQTADTTAPVDTATPADTGTPADTTEADTTALADTAPDEDGADTAEVVDPCADAICDELDCAPEHHVLEDGACCPTCVVPPQCEEPTDCVGCTYPSAPASADDCYCTLCPSHVTSAAECAANGAAWQAHCPEWAEQQPCPVVRCLPLAPPLCASGACVIDAQACNTADDCTRCLHTVTPANADECECPGCGVPMLTTQCSANEDAVYEWCIEFLDECVPPPCAPPQGEVACDEDTWRCTEGVPLNER